MIRFLKVTTISIALWSCGGPETPAVVNQAPGTAMIGGQGGAISLQNVATITAAPGVFSQNTMVKIESTATPQADETFKMQRAFFDARDVSSSTVTVTIGNQLPTGAISVRMNAAAAFLSPASGLTPRVILATQNGSDEEGPYDTYDLITPTIDQASSSLAFDAPREAFLRQNSQGNYFATFTLATSPGPIAGP